MIKAVREELGPPVPKTEAPLPAGPDKARHSVSVFVENHKKQGRFLCMHTSVRNFGTMLD